MTLEIASLLIVGAVVPIMAGLFFPLSLLRWFRPLWTFAPPVAITAYHMRPAPGGPGYATSEAFIGALFIFLFILVWPWMIWSRTVFRLLRERRAGIRHEPPRFLGLRP
jgi:hypothetical protein